MFDKKRFKAQAILKGLTMRQIAGFLNIDTVTLYRKMNGISDFFGHEIKKLCEILEIDDVESIFFADNIT